jgi:hypothetical protein
VWTREIGVMPGARPAWLALHRASPLAEALDPLRLDPPFSWERILPVLRFPTLCRLVAGRVTELGIGAAGGAMAEALFRFASLRQEATGAPALPRDVAFAVRFLAHAFWLDHLFTAERASPAATASTFAAAPVATDHGWDLSALLCAAHEIEPRLVWPPDVDPKSGLGAGFAERLRTVRAEVVAKGAARYEAALSLCRIASGRITMS